MSRSLMSISASVSVLWRKICHQHDVRQPRGAFAGCLLLVVVSLLSRDESAERARHRTATRKANERLARLLMILIQLALTRLVFCDDRQVRLLCVCVCVCLSEPLASLSLPFARNNSPACSSCESRDRAGRRGTKRRLSRAHALAQAAIVLFQTAS